MKTGKFIKNYEDSSVIIYKNDYTNMSIEYLKEENFYIVIDYWQEGRRSFVWEFPTYKEALICAKDYFKDSQIFDYVIKTNEGTINIEYSNENAEYILYGLDNIIENNSLFIDELLQYVNDSYQVIKIKKIPFTNIIN